MHQALSGTCIFGVLCRYERPEPFTVRNRFKCRFDRKFEFGRCLLGAPPLRAHSAKELPYG